MVATVPCTISMIRIVVDDPGVVNYNHRSVTIVMPSFGASLLEPSFIIAILFMFMVQATLLYLKLL